MLCRAHQPVRLPRRPIGAVGALLAALCASAGCARPPGMLDADWQSSFAEVIRPETALPDAADVEPGSGRLKGDAGYRLYVLTDAVGLDFTSPERFLETLHKHPNGRKDDHTVGHCWLILARPGGLMECGHTGEFGIVRPTYYRGISRRVRDGEPDPISYLWEAMPDGQFHRGPGIHKPTFVLRLPITRARHEAIYAYIDGYEYGSFRLTDHACTDFVAGAAALAGVNLAHRVRLTIPEEVTLRGRRVRLRTGKKYETISVSSPDLLEADLRRLAAEGVGEDATRWYLE